MDKEKLIEVATKDKEFVYWCTAYGKGKANLDDVMHFALKALCKELPDHKDNCFCMSESMAFCWNNYNQLKQWGNDE